MPRGNGLDPLYSLSIVNIVFHGIFLGKKAIVTSKHGTTIFFPITILI